MSSVKKLYRRFTPRALREFIYNTRGTLGLIPGYHGAKDKAKKIIEHSIVVRNYLKSRNENLNDEERVVYDYLSEHQENPVPVFPYHFTKKYPPSNIQVGRDKNGLPYVYHQEKKTIFQKRYVQRRSRIELRRALC